MTGKCWKCCRRKKLAKVNKCISAILKDSYSIRTWIKKYLVFYVLLILTYEFGIFCRSQCNYLAIREFNLLFLELIFPFHTLPSHLTINKNPIHFQPVFSPLDLHYEKKLQKFVFPLLILEILFVCFKLLQHGKSNCLATIPFSWLRLHDSIIKKIFDITNR